MTVRRAAAFALFVAVLVQPAGHARAQDATAPPDVFQARAEAGGMHDSIAVPAYFETFFPYSLSEASNGAAHGYHAIFYGGFFLTAAAEQQGFPPPPGTTETLYPQGPTSASAEAIPNEAGAFGSSTGESSATGSSGSATAGGGELPGVGRVGFGEASSLVVAAAGKVTSTARIVMHDVTLAGVVHIGTLVGEATAVATGTPGGASAKGALTFSDATVLGVPVDLGAPPDSGPLDSVLAPNGITVTRAPDVRSVASDGTRARLQAGGVTITFTRPEREFTLTVTFGRLDVSARAESIPPLPGRTHAGGITEEFLDEFLSVGGVAAGTLSVAPPLPVVEIGSGRAVRRTIVPFGADFSALAALIAVLSFAALFTRRVMHALVD